MFAKHVLVTAALATLAAAAMTTGAFAADNSAPSYDNFVSTKSRAEVKQQVLDARADGTLRPAGEVGEQVSTPVVGSPKTRAQLSAEVLQARANGSLVAAGQEGLRDTRPFVSTRDRAEVKAEARAEVRTHAFEQQYLP